MQIREGWEAYHTDEGFQGFAGCILAADWERREIMNLYEITLHGTESIYLLAPTKYRALELVGDYLADAGNPKMLESGNIVVRQLDLSEEQILRPEKCRACPLNE
jgi:hypothetical protein